MCVCRFSKILVETQNINYIQDMMQNGVKYAWVLTITEVATRAWEYKAPAKLRKWINCIIYVVCNAWSRVAMPLNVNYRYNTQMITHTILQSTARMSFSKVKLKLDVGLSESTVRYKYFTISISPKHGAHTAMCFKQMAEIPLRC